MKYRIDILETPEARHTKFTELGINRAVAKAYFFSNEAENDLINFDDCIFDEEIDEIIADCRRFRIREFTISSTFSGMTRTIALFIEKGCRLDGIATINDILDDVLTGEKRTIPAFKLSLN